MKNKLFLFLSLWVLAIFLDSLYPLDFVCSLSIAPLLGAALVAGGSTLLGSTLNYVSQSSANSVNAKWNQAQLDWDAMKLDRQQAFDREMYQKQQDYNDKVIAMMNDYNSPVAARQRLEQAGYNPYLSFGNIDAGSASSGVGVSQPSSPSGGSFNPIAEQPARVGDIFANTGRDIASIYQMYSNSELSSQQALNLKIKNMHENNRQIAEIDSIINSGKVDKEQADILRQSKQDLVMQNKYLAQQMQWDSKTKGQEYEQSVIDTKMRKVEYQILEWRNKLDKQLAEQNIKLTDKQIQHLDHVIWNIDADTALKAAQKVMSEAQKIGIDITNDQAKQLAPLLVQRQKLENKSIQLSNEYGNNAYTFGGRLIDRVKSFWNRPRSKYQHRYDYNQGSSTGRRHTIVKY